MPVPGPPPGGRPGQPLAMRRWSSFVAPQDATGRAVRSLHEERNPRHRLRVEYDSETLLIHLSDEDGDGWTTFAVDRGTRIWAVAQGVRQEDAARESYSRLYHAQRTDRPPTVIQGEGGGGPSPLRGGTPPRVRRGSRPQDPPAG